MYRKWLLYSAVALAVQQVDMVDAVQEQKNRTSAVGDCCPQQGDASEDLCKSRGCLWTATADRSPYCTFPQEYGYKANTEPTVSASGFEVLLSRINTTSLFGNDVNNLKLTVTYETSSRLHVKFTDVDETRYQVPKEAVDVTYDFTSPPDNETRLYDVTWKSTPRFGLRVKRRSTGAVVFDTTTPGFVFSDQYLQLTLALPSANVYGFGEHNHRRFQHDMNWKKWSIFTRDEAPVDEWNLYGAQTMYMNLEEDGNANSVFLLNSNAMDVVVQPKPYPAITYHVIGGILDFYIFLGPTPENVVQQYTEAVGRPLMPPYWSLGFQLSRWDYNNLTYVQQVVDRNIEAGIPQDVQYGDIDYMESKLDFTYDKVLYAGLPEFVESLHNKGKKYIIILDHILGSDHDIIQEKLNGTYYALSDGIDKRVFIFDPRNKTELLYAEVWPGESVYPDYTLGDNVTSWWTYHCGLLWKGTGGEKGIEYDALWIDMNEPSSFIPGSTTGCEKNTLNYPPYVPKILGADYTQGSLFDKTICMDAEQKWGLHYNVHSLYGHSMAITTFRALRDLFPEKRPLVLTRSNFAGTQKYGAHWLGDNQSQWRQIPWSIVGMLEYSLFGFSYTGSDICGFYYETTEQMCQRWMQLGAFYPYSRNHNAQGFRDQDPAAFSEEMVRVSRDILMTRYTLLPFLYTLLHEAHVHGSTVVRPLLHEFPTDKATWSVDRQFLWGPSFMISPVMEEDVTWVNAYVPSGTWYDFYTGAIVESTGSYFNLSTPLDKIQLHVRAGYIIPWQEPANSTVYSRLNPMGLLVALDRGSGKSTKGSLFWDDGESFGLGHLLNGLVIALQQKHFRAARFCIWSSRLPTTRHLTYFIFETNDILDGFRRTRRGLKGKGSLMKLDIVVKKNGYPEAGSLVFDTIDIYGFDQPPNQFYVNGTVLGGRQVGIMTTSIRLTNLTLPITGNHQITWSVEQSSTQTQSTSTSSTQTETESTSESSTQTDSSSTQTESSSTQTESTPPSSASNLSRSACVFIATLICTLLLYRIF